MRFVKCFGSSGFAEPYAILMLSSFANAIHGLQMNIPPGTPRKSIPVPFWSECLRPSTEAKPRVVCTEEECTRRRFLSGAVAATGGAIVSAVPFPADASAKGAKGAAEYDLEFYLRDVLKGNTREGNLPASAAPPSPPPRKLSGPLLPLMMDNACTSDCAPVRMLSKISGTAPSVISEKVEDYRAKASKAFGSKSLWETEDVSDQYYFDLTSYALWRTASDLIPDYKKRDNFVRETGRTIYKDSRKMGLLKKPPLARVEDSSDDSSDDKGASSDSSDSSDDSSTGPLTGTIPAVLEVLELFNASGFCSSYRLGGDDPSRSGKFVFDELDDDDIFDGTSVNCLVSVYSPAVLGAALQITGEGSRFSPDFVGNTLLGLWEEAGIIGSFESYFVDPEYRPNPKDFFPNEQLLQFTLKRKK
mmetsp:Transcript_11653/g.34261  ORF Transcript_11653/g.34261 Transcript_11653/m.34261 type:complete len:417 (-) Transcript_11653:62-1312(-)